jgi:DNA-binding GntR family transcriptional regulator
VNFTERIYELVRERGEMTPGRHSVQRQVADVVGCTSERARVALLELARDGRIVLADGSRGVRGPRRITFVRLPPAMAVAS